MDPLNKAFRFGYRETPLSTQGSGEVKASQPAPYAPGTVVTLTASAQQGSHFDHWTVNGAEQTANPLMLTLQDGETTWTCWRSRAGSS